MISKFIGAVLGGALILGATSAANAVPFDFSGPTAANVDSSTPTVLTLSVVSPGFSVADLNIFIDLDGDNETDISASIEHLGTSLTLVIGDESCPNGLGFPCNTGQLTFDDEGSTTPAGGSLSIFDGLDLSGDWNLTLVDNTSFPGDLTPLAEWRIFGNATVSAVSEPPMLAHARQLMPELLDQQRLRLHLRRQ